MLRMGIQNPPLLPEKLAQPVQIRAGGVKVDLSPNDLSEITNLVSRVPQLDSYEIKSIYTPPRAQETSPQSRGETNVYVSISRVVVMLHKSSGWTVDRITAFPTVSPPP